MLIEVKTDTEVEFYFRKVSREEIVKRQYSPKGGWEFRWLKPLSQSFEIYGLVTEKYPTDVQGLIAARPNYDEDFLCVDVDIIESSPKNKKMIKGKINPNRTYIGVGKCLVAFACQYSIDKGLEGFVELTSKSSKYELYKELGAYQTYGQSMVFSDIAANQLAQIYFPEGVKWWER
ncbi:hypothetical protein [Aneurinibacillus terranovensis]|uniref:hypothetical protein n=1 Tax=Aneurinibacillus terranovensis TaxID=278991 RepID=UPI00040EF5FE|nr:hypothetical protein [Aneurinibacillus terranovensis]